MYQVSFFKHNQLVKSFEFTTEKKAITFLVENADANCLDVSSNQYHATSGGTIPELQINISQFGIKYEVNFYTNKELINTICFDTEHEAEFCLVSHADNQSLKIREDYYYASSNGTTRSEEIEIVEINN
jgi:hypothetical protein